MKSTIRYFDSSSEAAAFIHQQIIQHGETADIIAKVTEDRDKSGIYRKKVHIQIFDHIK